MTNAREIDHDESPSPDVLWRDGALGRLPHLGLLRFVGPDAIAFLQGQVSNDTAPLSGGEPVLAAYSTPQGRALAILHLMPHSSGIIGILPRDIAAPTLERLRKFVLRAKVKIEDVSDQYVVAGMHRKTLAGVGAAGSAGYVEQDGVGIGRVHSGAIPGSDRCWVIGESAAIGAAGFGLAASSADIEHVWRLADIREGLPQVYAATSEMFVAQMLNLDLIGGVSFSKGCYTGQEIIARTQHLGRIKRRMFRLRLPSGSWSIGQPLRLAGGRSGRLTEVAAVGDGFEALAVLSLEAGAADADAGSAEPISAEVLSLSYPSIAPTAQGR